MELKFSPEPKPELEPFNLASSMKQQKEQGSNKSSTDETTTTTTPHSHGTQDEEEETSLSLSSLSKLILPPLGVSSYTQNQTKSKWIISPMDSRYRFVLINEKHVILFDCFPCENYSFNCLVQIMLMFFDLLHN